MDKQAELDSLARQITYINSIMKNVSVFVKAARMSGATWEEIGTALGVTKQRAHQLYADKMGYEFPLDVE
jgi:hypothetical protein